MLKYSSIYLTTKNHYVYNIMFRDIYYYPHEHLWSSCHSSQMSATSVKLAAYSHSAEGSPKKVSPKRPPKRFESSPTTHFTKTSFLHVLDAPDHFGTIYIFDHFFTYIHNLDLFFSANFL